MAHDSDTESEPESSLLQSSVPVQVENITGTAADVKTAVQTLKCLEEHNIQQNETKILSAANIITNFLAHPFSAASLKDGGVRQSLDAFSALINPSFLALLFVYRKTFHAIAAQALAPGTSVSTIVCWVDAVLAHLSEATLTIAHGILHHDPQSHHHGILNMTRQTQDNNLRAAAQLPEKWQAVPGVISSERASPAAKRLALRMTFAVYIIGPQFSGYDPWKDGGVQPSDMMKILRAHITQLRGTVATPSSAIDLSEQERLGYAMIVSLFAASESAIQDLEPLSPFKPHTFAFLLHLIQLILHLEDNGSSSLISPREVLDPAETILVRWGLTVPWSWKIWGDPRIANAECVTHLTATWLFHLDSSLFEITLPGEAADHWKNTLMQHLVRHPAAASSGILQVLYHSISSLCSLTQLNCVPQHLINNLSKCCWATIQLLNLAADVPTEQSSAAVLELCKCSCILYSLLGNTGDGEIEIKYLIVEALTLVPPHHFRSAMTSVLSDPKVQFVIKLDEVIARSKQQPTSAVLVDAGHFSSTERYLHDAKLALNFLTIGFQNGPRGFLRGQTVSLFLASLVEHLPREHPDSLPSTILCDSLYSALATLEALRSHVSSKDVCKLWEDRALWQMVMNYRRSDLPVSAAFAHYVIFAPDLRDTLCCTEAWDYCRDVLLLVLSRHFLGENEPLALTVCPSVCRALLRLLLQADSQAVRFILSSPWTTQLCVDLQFALEKGNDKPQDDEYATILRDRLDTIGKVLLNKIKRKLHPDNAGPRLETPEFESRLIFWVIEYDYLQFDHVTTLTELLDRISQKQQIDVRGKEVVVQSHASSNEGSS